jgi:SAM-dependent methyltransferase
MEAGCGRGRISARLCQEGASVTCLDIAPEALDMARTHFPPTVAADFVQGSILSMPRNRRYDIVWNAGVLEHFVADDQRQSVGEFLDLLEPGGKVILLTPYSRSLFYRVAKFVLEKTGRWPFGRETPLTTLKHVIPEHGVLQREYTAAFLPLVFDSHKWFRPLRPICRVLRDAMFLLLRERGIACLDRILSVLLGGYLLVSVVERREETSLSQRKAA